MGHFKQPIAHATSARVGRTDMPSILIAGAPCSGKTTYARTIGLPVLDYDDIVEQLCGERYTDDQAIRSHARALFRAGIPDAEVVVWTAPRRADRGRFRSQYGAQVVVTMAPIEVCLERARISRPESWQAAIHRWFSEWEPSTSGGDVVISTTHPASGLADSTTRSEKG